MSAEARVRVTLLDRFAVHRYGNLTYLPRSEQRVVAHVSLAGHQDRVALAGHLWPDVPQCHAQGNLRSSLWRLQKRLPGLVTSAQSTLSLAPGVAVDVREVSDWAQRALDPGEGAEDLRRAPSGWRGELLPGWYDDWVLVERERIRQLRMYALEALAAKLARAGRFADAVAAAYAAISAEPLRESAHRTLIRLHLAEGNTAEAIRVFERFRDLLSAELDIAPSDRMRRLIEELPRPRSRPVLLNDGATRVAPR